MIRICNTEITKSLGIFYPKNYYGTKLSEICSKMFIAGLGSRIGVYSILNSRIPEYLDLGSAEKIFFKELTLSSDFFVKFDEIVLHGQIKQALCCLLVQLVVSVHVPERSSGTVNP
jgi:hypothetical protein